MRSVLYSDLPGWDAASRGQTGLENAALGGLRVPPTPFGNLADVGVLRP